MKAMRICSLMDEGTDVHINACVFRPAGNTLLEKGLVHEVHKRDGCCISENKKHMTHLRFGLCNLPTPHSGDCICYTCESDYVTLSRDRREQALPLDKDLTCGKDCDCNDVAHPGCCKILDFNYNKPCCLIEGHDTIGVPGVVSKSHLCEPCRAHYIEKHFDELQAGGAFPRGPNAALTPRDFVAVYSQSFKTPVVEGDAGYIPLDPDPWSEEEIS